MLLVSSIVLLAHVVISFVLLFSRPRAFLQYHIVLTAFFASGLFDVFENAKFSILGGDVKPSGLLWLGSFVMMTLFVALHLEILGKKKSWFLSHYLMFLVFIVCIQVTVGNVSFPAILHFLELVYPLLTFVIAYHFVRSEKDFESIVRAYVQFAVALAVLIPLNYAIFGLQEDTVLAYARVMSTSLLPAFFLLLTLALRQKRHMVLAAILFLIPILTISRGVTAAILVSLFVYYGGRVIRGGISKKLILFTVAMCVVIYGIAMSDAFQHRVLVQEDADEFDMALINTSGRLRIWSFFVDKMAESSTMTRLFGQGLGASDVYAYESDPTQWFRQPHSEYLRFIYNAGLIGFLLYYALYVRFLKSAKRELKEVVKDTHLAEASILLIYGIFVLSLYENFLLYSPFGFTQNAFVLFAVFMRSAETRQPIHA